MTERMDPKLVEPSGEHSPGAHLRQARKAANMSVDHVASALHLKGEMIEALEADAFDRLPASTFVRGYLRGYARVLGLPPEPVLVMYDRQGFKPPPLATETVETKQAHISDLPVRLVTYAVGLLLVLLVGLWWWSQEDIGFDIAGDDLLGWWSDLAPASIGAPGTAQGSGETDGDSAATASGPAPEASQAEVSRGGEPPMPSPSEGAAPGSVAADAPVPAGSDAGDPSVAMTTGRANGVPQDGEPSAPSSDERTPFGSDATGAPVPTGGDAGGPSVATAPSQAIDASPGNAPTAPPAGGDAVPGGIPADAPAPTGGDTGGQSVATAPSQAIDVPPGSEPTMDSSGEGAAPAGIAGAGPAADGAAGSETMADRETSAAPGSQPETAAGSDSTAGPEATAVAPETATPPLAPGTLPSGTASVSTGADAEAPAALETASPGLVLAFTHESWVEVYDRERVRLFFGLAQSGRVLHFEGAQPFDVLLGYGEDVRVAIDGEAFDHTPYINHGVARFSVGSAPGATDSADVAQTVAPDGIPTDAAAPNAAPPEAIAPDAAAPDAAGPRAASPPPMNR